MKVSVDPDLCNGYGHCVIEAPDYFTLDDNTGKSIVIKDDVAEGDRARIDNAIVLCPVQAISLSA